MLEELAQHQQEVFQQSQGQRDQKAREAERAEMQKLQEMFDTQLRGILTKEQWQEYQQFLEERQPMRPPRRN